MGAHPRAGKDGHPANRRLGYLAALGAAGFAGFIPVIAKRDLGSVDPLLVAGFNNLLAGLVLIPLAPRPAFAPGDGRRVLFIAVVGGAIAPVLYFVGLQSTTASEGALLVNAETVFTVALAVLILQERAGPREFAAVGGVIVGAAVLTTDLRPSISPAHLAGNLIIVVASLVWAFDNATSTGLTRRNPPSAVAAWKNVTGSALVLGAALAVAADFSTIPSHFGSLLVVGAVGTGVSLGLFYFALRHIGAYRTSAIFGLQGLFGAAGGYALVGDRLSGVQIAAAALMLASVLMLALFHKAPETPPEAASGDGA
jgi:drug/metabolite transporter (DMT)-like permease